MKTKTLLIAAAALAAGIISSQAQSVYSQNVVGYANVATPVGGVNYLLAVPFKVGVSNGANEVFPSLPEFSEILIWNPLSVNYTFAKSDTGSGTGWSDAFDGPVPVPVLPVGLGFFLKPASGVTNTIAGSVAINTGTSNVMTLATGGVNYLIGCAVPYAGSVTNGNDSGGGPNLNALPEFSEMLVWNPNTVSYTFAKTDTGSATGWSDAFDGPVAVPSITVGQGFFLKPAASNAKWITGLPAQ